MNKYPTNHACLLSKLWWAAYLHVYLAINRQDSNLVFMLVINALIRKMEGGWQIQLYIWWQSPSDWIWVVALFIASQWIFNWILNVDHDCQSVSCLCHTLMTKHGQYNLHPIFSVNYLQTINIFRIVCVVVCFDYSIISLQVQNLFSFVHQTIIKSYRCELPPLLQKARPAHLVLDLAENSIFEIFCEAGVGL